MFFIGIFGISNKQVKIKEFYNIYCKRCKENVSGKLMKTFNYFHLFFIPLFKWNEKYYFICNDCQDVYEVSKEKGKAIEHGEAVEITYWDLNEYRGEHEKDTNSNYRICANCRKSIDKTFEFCPHCGKKVR